MGSAYHVECIDCRHQIPFSPLTIACPRCDSQWLNAVYHLADLKDSLLANLAGRPFDLWRYRELLPVSEPSLDLRLGEGGTPLVRAVNLGMMLGCANIYIKDERQGPTASFKDRQAAVTIAALKEAGVTEAVIASTGNVAMSYSAYAARAGIKLWAFITSLVPGEKMREVAIYGTQVVKVTSTYDQAKHVAAEFAHQRGLYLDRGARSISTVESMKTIAYEISEQLAHSYPSQFDIPAGQHGTLPWLAPDWYIQAVSGGMGPLGVLKGCEELRDLNLIEKIPRMAIIQTEGCSPMVQAWKQGKDTVDPILSPRSHIATLSTGDPGRVYTLLKEKMNGGVFESVTDEEAFRAMHILAKMEGISSEPAAAVAFAGLIKLVRHGVIQPEDVVVVNCSGHTMPIEPIILGNGWARNVVLPSRAMESTPQEGLLAALNRVTPNRYYQILIVDDHPEARRLIRRILQAQGDYMITEASNGAEALQIAQDELPDLIVLDLMMPGMDGFSVLDALKSNKMTAEIPVIVVTAKSLTRHEKRTLTGQIQTLMHKGDFLSDELLQQIKASVK